MTAFEPGAWLGVARSLALYYGVPFRLRRMSRFYAQLVPPDSLCFDIGAHAGNRVRCFRRLGARVVAVEPQPPFIRLLQLLYRRDPSVAIEQRAVGRAPGRVRLLVSARTPTVTTLSRRWIDDVRRDRSFLGVSWSEGDEVELTTLQALIDEHGLPAFTKIDVEGYEAEVLAGVHVPLPALSFEYLPAARHVALDCIDRLAELGDYAFNWSPGESHRFGWNEWRDAESARELIRALDPSSGSGDVYAKLRTALPDAQ